MALQYNYAYNTHKDLDKTVFSLYKKNDDGEWDTIDVARGYEIHGTVLPTKFATDLTTEPDIPEMFQDALVSYVVYKGYSKPPNLNPQLAQLMYANFEKTKKEYKKWCNSNGVKFGSIVSQDF